MVTTFIFQFGQQFFKPLSHPNGFYWGHQSLWTFTPANSMQSNDRNRKKPGQMQSLNLLCSTIFGVCFVVPLHCYSAQGLLRAIVAAPLKRPSQAEILQHSQAENWDLKIGQKRNGRIVTTILSLAPFYEQSFCHLVLCGILTEQARTDCSLMEVFKSAILQ